MISRQKPSGPRTSNSQLLNFQHLAASFAVFCSVSTPRFVCFQQLADTFLQIGGWAPLSSIHRSKSDRFRSRVSRFDFRVSLRCSLASGSLSRKSFIFCFTVYFRSKSFVCRFYALRPGWWGPASQNFLNLERSLLR